MSSYLGLSTFVIQSGRFPVDDWLDIITHGNGPRAMTCLWKTFGENNDGFHKFMDAFPSRKKLIEIHLSNGAGRRKDNSGKGHFLPGVSPGEFTKRLKNKHQKTLDAIANRTLEIEEFCSSIQDGLTEMVLCPELEDNIRDLEAYKVFVQTIRNFWPGTIVRSSIVDGHHKDGANYFEKHGSDARGNSKTIVNEDGEEKATFAMSKTFLEANLKRNTKAIIFWRRAHQGDGLPRRQRSYKISDKDKAGFIPMFENH